MKPSVTDAEIINYYLSGKSREKTSLDLNVSDYRVRNVLKKSNSMRLGTKYRNITDKFVSPLSAEESYWLGFIAADGHIIYQPGRKMDLVVEINKKDKTHLDKLTNFLGFGNVHYRNRNDDCVIFTYSSRSLVNNLIQWVYPNNKTELNNFFRIPKQNQFDFIRGYFDGDGCYTNKGISFTSCPETLIPISDHVSSNIGRQSYPFLKKGDKALGSRWYGKKWLGLFYNQYNGLPRLERKWEKIEQFIGVVSNEN